MTPTDVANVRAHRALLHHLALPAPDARVYRLWLGPGAASEPLTTFAALVAAARSTL